MQNEIELVIRIPEVDYKHFKELCESLPKDPLFVDSVVYYIGNGTPLKEGHWEDSSNGWMCSECKTDHRTDTKYCPTCGARMESEVKE